MDDIHNSHKEDKSMAHDAIQRRVNIYSYVLIFSEMHWIPHYFIVESHWRAAHGAFYVNYYIFICSHIYVHVIFNCRSVISLLTSITKHLGHDFLTQLKFYKTDKPIKGFEIIKAGLKIRIGFVHNSLYFDSLTENGFTFQLSTN